MEKVGDLVLVGVGVEVGAVCGSWELGRVGIVE